ncbi:hypothetical protein F8568_043105 [Actinomadura sp. LD22]|uniref:Uncharacterized protein n=1 Tax=Actinomadura physcomitrii TaxID=2650748 RepID=A0A6I4MXB8_9ACTN|nr:hypothetical protein [Actinomadura physcomitrii]MWA07016.1 hypothetical protein [Actinomadura physcomitrii]
MMDARLTQLLFYVSVIAMGQQSETSEVPVSYLIAGILGLALAVGGVVTVVHQANQSTPKSSELYNYGNR